ncbi:uncharacterized protein LOC119566301 isoform X2 [Chelonia mydas]|uniref:uncharacterized protein LOC119566301 isoform X2 n=1 Tax=Chelonia mydas TaxID=8469 RepID=UPI001CA8F90B|nr:uncharacterized protein LOC119566301 isoform X2 [Chelonia mydas]XP_043404197.1 uncharacterized protein LOC119566301 isoform X2 [Chelonia mydas]
MFSGIATALRGVKIYTLERCRYTNLSPSVGSARWTDEFSKRPGYCLSGRWMPTRMGEALAHTASSLTRWLDKPVTALLGSDVLLTCSFPAAPCGAGTGRAAAGDLVLPGPGADGAGRHRGHHEEGGRVFAPELPRGNASLLLPRVTLAEQGPYRCSVHYGGQRGEGSVRLRVAGAGLSSLARQQVTGTMAGAGRGRGEGVSLSPAPFARAGGAARPPGAGAEDPAVDAARGSPAGHGAGGLELLLLWEEAWAGAGVDLDPPTLEISVGRSQRTRQRDWRGRPCCAAREGDPSEHGPWSCLCIAPRSHRGPPAELLMGPSLRLSVLPPQRGQGFGPLDQFCCSPLDSPTTAHCEHTPAGEPPVPQRHHVVI